MPKLFLPVAVLLLLAACAQVGPMAGSGAGSGSVTMYGILDQGVSFSGH